MKKRIFGLTLALAAALSINCFAAENGSVVYNGETLECTGGMDAFGSMLPGVPYTDTITLTNTSENTANFYMDTNVVNTLSQDGASGAGYTVSLTCGDSVLYGFDPATGEATGALLGGDGTGELEELNSILGRTNGENYQMVATLEPGESVDVSLMLQADGTSLDNDYQNAVGSIQFQFIAEELEPVTETVVNQVQLPPEVVTQTRYVQTGDNSLVWILGGVAVVAIGGFVFLSWKKKKKEKED